MTETGSKRLAVFLREDLETIADEFLSTAAARFGRGETVLGDFVNPLLLSLAVEIDRPGAPRSRTSAAARFRLPGIAPGFTTERVSLEFSLLQETILRLWRAQSGGRTEDMANFHRAFDALLASALRAPEP